LQPKEIWEKKGGVTQQFLTCLSLGTETTEIMAAAFQILLAQNKQADLTCKANKSEKKCWGKDNTVLHRNTGTDF